MSDSMAALQVGARRDERSVVPQLMTLAEVAKTLRVSEKTVRRLVARRAIRCVRLGRAVRFQPADLLRFVEARKE